MQKKPMRPLTDAERKELNALLGTGTPLPEKWLHRLFPNGRKAESVGKEYRLVYEGKLTREEVPAQTPAAPWLSSTAVMSPISVRPDNPSNCCNGIRRIK